MSARFEELDWRPTPIGDISLRRRVDLTTGREVHEVKLGDEYLMSSLFTEAERQLAHLGLARAPQRDGLAVAVGGLGLGYTAAAALADPRVGELVVVDALQAVIDWHEAGLVPLGPTLTGDPRTRLVRGDFFALVAGGGALDGGPSPRRFDAVLLDVDHSPRHVLHPSHADFYTEAGLRRLAALLNPDGVFGLWSDDPPDEEFLAVLEAVMPGPVAHVVRFPNPLTGGESASTVYVAVRAPG